MNGWIETKTPGIFADVGVNDLVIRTSSRSDAIVIGNDSKLVAGLYLKDNNVGVRCLPSTKDTSLTVNGDVLLYAGDNTLAFSSTDVNLGIGREKSLIASDDGIIATSSFQTSDWPVKINYDGTASAETLISKKYLKIAKEFHNARILRVYEEDSSIDVIGSFFASDISHFKYLFVQGKVAEIVSIEPFSNSIHVSFKPLPFSFEIGPVALFGLDSSLMDMSTFGDLSAAREKRRSEKLATLSAKIETIADGRSCFQISFMPDERIDFKPSELICVAFESSSCQCNSADDYEKINLFTVVEASCHSLTLTHPDPATSVQVVYPGIAKRIIGKTQVDLTMNIVSKTSRRIEIHDSFIAFQTDKVIINSSSEAITYLSTRNAFVKLEASFEDDDDIVSIVPLSTMLSGNKLSVNFAGIKTKIATGTAKEIVLDTFGAPCTVVSISYPIQNRNPTALLKITSPTIPMFKAVVEAISKDFLCTSDGVNPATHFKVLEKISEDVGSNTLQVLLEFGSVSDSKNHVPYSEGTSLSLFGYESDLTMRVSLAKENTKRESLVFDLPIGINVKDPKDSTLAVGGDVSVSGSISVGSLEISSSLKANHETCATHGTLDETLKSSATLKAQEISVDAGLTTIMGDLAVGEITKVSPNGTAAFGDSVVSSKGDYYRIKTSFVAQPDETRSFSNKYDYSLGELVRTFKVSVSHDLAEALPSSGLALVKLDKYRYKRNGNCIELFYNVQKHHDDEELPHHKIFDVAGKIDIDIIEPVSSTTRHYSTFEISVKDVKEIDSASVRLVVEEYQLMDVGRRISLLAVNSCEELPNNVLLVTSVKQSEQHGLYFMDLELLNGFDSMMSSFTGIVVPGCKITACYVKSPFESVVNEKVSNVSFWTSAKGEYVATMVPVSPASVLRVDAGVSPISSITILGAKLIPIRIRSSSAMPLSADGAIDAILAEQPSVIVSSSSTLDARVTMKGAPAYMDKMRSQGLNDVTLDIRLPDRTRLDLAKLKAYESGVVFANGRPWRMSYVKETTDSYVVSMNLRRMSRVQLDDLLDLPLGSALSIMPVESVSIDVVETDLLKARAVTISEKHILAVREDRLIIDESISLSKDDEYVRFLKDVFIQGNLVAKSMSHVSDRTFKRDMATRPPEQDLEVVRRLAMYDYNFLDPDSVPRKEYGVVADELETILPDAVKEVDGFLANVYSFAKFSGGTLIVKGLFSDVISNGSLIQITRKTPLQNQNPSRTTHEIRVLSSYDQDGHTFLSFDVADSVDLNDEGDYFVYGTWSKYKVVNTTHLLMTCMNAVKALANVLHF